MFVSSLQVTENECNANRTSLPPSAQPYDMLYQLLTPSGLEYSAMEPILGLARSPRKLVMFPLTTASGVEGHLPHAQSRYFVGDPHTTGLALWGRVLCEFIIGSQPLWPLKLTRSRACSNVNLRPDSRANAMNSLYAE